MNAPKKRKPVESPRNTFDAAKLIHKALENLDGDAKLRAVRWALESRGYYSDITLKLGSRP
jgi:hypothetical protein